MEKIQSWLQIVASLGLIGGLTLFGIQMNHSTEMVRLQTLGAESQRVAEAEYILVGERGGGGLGEGHS